jgi:hypothetical protein
LLKSTVETVKELFSFCDLPYSKFTNDFLMNFNAKNNDDAYSVFKKKQVDDLWKEKLNPEIIAAINSDIQINF